LGVYAGSTFANWRGDFTECGPRSVTKISVKSVTASFAKSEIENSQKVYLPVVMK